jgi:hypothetical protein
MFSKSLANVMINSINIQKTLWYQTNLVKIIQEKEHNPEVSVSNTVTNNNSNIQQSSHSLQKVLSDSSNKDSLNVSNCSSKEVIADSSTKDRTKDHRVSFLPMVTGQQHPPPVTPLRDPLPAYYSASYAYPNITAWQSPTSPSIQYLAYHGYGVPLYINGPVQGTNQANVRFVNRSRNVSED